VDNIAKGAALITDTTYERMFIDGLADTVSNFVLERTLHQNFEELGVPSYTEEEHAYADALAQTYEGSDHIPGIAAEHDPLAEDAVRALREKNGHAMNDFLAPLYQGNAFRAGSTDVGDVSWLTPTAQIHVAAWPNGCPGHSWQNVSCDRTEIGHKAAVHAGKVIAATAIDLFTTPEILKQARAEFEKRTTAGYTCPIPADAVPVVPDLGGSSLQKSDKL
jgi:aminobenzoyl-glutamate utilization protein B